MNGFLYENHWGGLAWTFKNLLGVLSMLNVLIVLNVLNVLNVLDVLNVLSMSEESSVRNHHWPAGLACLRMCLLGYLSTRLSVCSRV